MDATRREFERLFSYLQRHANEFSQLTEAAARSIKTGLLGHTHLLP